MTRARDAVRAWGRCGAGLGLLAAVAATVPPPPLEAASLREQSFGAPRLMLRAEEAQRLRDLLAAPPAPPSEAKTEAPADERPPAPPAPAQPVETAVAALPNVYLGALLYFGRGNWSFWLNDARFAPDVQHPEFTVLRVDPRAVTLRWTPAGRAGSYTFTLQPRQTYIPARNLVREGRVAAPGAAGEAARR